MGRCGGVYDAKRRQRERRERRGERGEGASEDRRHVVPFPLACDNLLRVLASSRFSCAVSRGYSHVQIRQSRSVGAIIRGRNHAKTHFEQFESTQQVFRNRHDGSEIVEFTCVCARDEDLCQPLHSETDTRGEERSLPQ